MSERRPTSRERANTGLSVRREFWLPDGAALAEDDAPAITSALADAKCAPELLDYVWGTGRAPARSLRAMHELEWAANEPASDAGHLKYYPRGALVFELLRAWLEELLTLRFGAAAVRTPLFYDWSMPDIHGEAGTFEDNLYFVRARDESREFAMRFGGDFGIFRMLGEVPFSYAQLPHRMFESAPCLRRDARGGLRGLERVRSCWLMDAHSVCADEEGARAEYIDTFLTQARIMREEGFSLAVDISVVEDTRERDTPWIRALLKETGVPAFVDVLSRPKHYWDVKHTFRTEAGYKMFHAQLDRNNGPRYGIRYTDATGKKRDAVIVHSAWGSIERWMFVLLERALVAKVPVLPLWLAPTQARLVPVSTTDHESALRFARELRQKRIRVDVDDRDKTLGWRMRAAGEEWVPYVAVVGPKEQADGAEWRVNARGGAPMNVSLDAFAARIAEETGDRPFRHAPAPALRARPRYR